MFKINNKGTRTRSSDFIVDFEHISHLFLVFLLLNTNLKTLKLLTAVFINRCTKALVIWQLIKNDRDTK